VGDSPVAVVVGAAAVAAVTAGEVFVGRGDEVMLFVARCGELFADLE